MSEVKWIKLSTQMFEDEKIRLIESMPNADTILIIWVKLLSQAGKTNASGYIYLNENIPFTEEMLATLFNRPVSSVRLALQTFQQFGMIEVNEENFIAISNWEKHQNVDGLDKIRKQTRERVARYRQKQKLALGCNVTGNDTVTDSNDTSNITVTDGNETEEEKEKEKEKDINNISLQIENLRQRYTNDQLKIIDDYLEMIRHTRKSGKISESVILKMYESWNSYPTICVEYGLYVHTSNVKYHSKKENYTLGIIRGTTADEAERNLKKISSAEGKEQNGIIDYFADKEFDE